MTVERILPDEGYFTSIDETTTSRLRTRWIIRSLEFPETSKFSTTVCIGIQITDKVNDRVFIFGFLKMLP